MNGKGASIQMPIPFSAIQKQETLAPCSVINHTSEFVPGKNPMALRHHCQLPGFLDPVMRYPGSAAQADRFPIEE